MKSKKSVVLLISILFPLIITAYVGMYMYGIVGTWKNNQEKFENNLINQDVETDKGMDTYLKLSHSSFIYDVDNFKLYTGSFSDKKNVGQNKKTGTYDLPNFSITSVSGTVVGDDSNASHDFYFTNINHNKVTPKNIVVLTVKFDPENPEESYETLEKAYKQFQERYSDSGNKGYVATSSTVNFYDKHAVKADADENKGTPLAVDIQIRRTYPLYKVDDEGNIEEDSSGNKVVESQVDLYKLKNALVAFVEVFSDNSENLLCFGELTNIISKSSDVEKANNVIKGNYSYSSNLRTLENAGYFKFIWPTILWQAAIAFVASGLLAFFFYRTWSADDNAKTESKDLTVKKKNVKTNKFVSFIKSVFGHNDWLTSIVIALISLFVLIQFYKLGVVPNIADNHFTLLIVVLSLFGLALAGFAYICIINLKKSNKHVIDQTLFALDIVTFGLLIMFIAVKFKNPEPYIFYSWIVLGSVSIILTTLRIVYMPLKEEVTPSVVTNVTANTYYQSIFKKYGFVLPIVSIVLLYALTISCDLFNIFTFINETSRTWLIFDFTLLLGLTIFLTLDAISALKNSDLTLLDLFLLIIDVVTLAIGVTFVITDGHVAKFIMWLVLLVLTSTLTSMRIQFINKKNKK